MHMLGHWSHMRRIWRAGKCTPSPPPANRGHWRLGDIITELMVWAGISGLKGGIKLLTDTWESWLHQAFSSAHRHVPVWNRPVCHAHLNVWVKETPHALFKWKAYIPHSDLLSLPALLRAIDFALKMLITHLHHAATYLWQSRLFALPSLLTAQWIFN